MDELLITHSEAGIDIARDLSLDPPIAAAQQRPSETMLEAGELPPGGEKDRARS
ncbi:hypothetical protein ABT344_11410 [Micromonospora carbonacea]|uniref:hypothetical protein n=1 Tax=Micromonospora carbonacea TaxID=47853 RepID=UPI00331A850D